MLMLDTNIILILNIIVNIDARHLAMRRKSANQIKGIFLTNNTKLYDSKYYAIQIACLT